MTLQTREVRGFSVNNHQQPGNNLSTVLDLDLLNSSLNVRELDEELLLETSILDTVDVINTETVPTNEPLEFLEVVNFDTHSEIISNDSFDGFKLGSFNNYDSAGNVYSSYDLSASLNFAQASNSDYTNYFQGTLGADTFTVDTRYSTTVVSGNGNVHYGSGYQDVLDLSSISVSQLSDYSYEIFDSSHDNGGARLFDSLTLSNGSKILFEGIDKILFSDYEYDLSIDPNDPGFGDQWNLHMMGVQNAWRFTTGSDSVLVGVQDSGLGVFNGSIHHDLGNTIYYSDNIADEMYREVPGDSYQRNSSHGTAVQGIIAAETDNSIGVAGINWNSDIFNIDLDIDQNSGDWDIVDATQSMIDHANAQGQNLVINMSISYSYDSDFVDLVANNQDNALFVIATGNESNSSISSPSVLANWYGNVIAVGATESDGFRASYSNYGQGITLMGPTEVLTTGAFRDRGFDYHDDFNGTSAATPNVAGVASLVWSANPNLSATDIKGILSETAYDLGYQGYDWEYGHGFVNADAAVRRAMALSSSDSQSSTLSSDDFSAASYSTYSYSEADIGSFTVSDLDNQITLEEDSILFTEEAYNDISLDSLENSAISFGTTSDFGAITALSDSFSEGLSYDSPFVLSENGLGEEDVFSSAVEI